MNLIHNKTYNYLFGHFAGVLVGEYLSTGKAVQFGKVCEAGALHLVIVYIRQGVFWFSFTLANLCAYSSALYNSWPDLLPAWTIPYYLAVTKAMIVFAFTLIVLSANSLTSGSKKSAKSEKSDKPVEPVQSSNASIMMYTLFMILSRIAIPLNLVNYYFIRWDFFTSRIPFETRTFSFVSGLSEVQLLTVRRA